MFPLSKGWMMVAAFGYGVLLSLAIRGAVQIVGRLVGMPVSEHIAGNVFLIGSLTLGSLFVFLYLRSLKETRTPDAGLASLGERDEQRF